MRLENRLVLLLSTNVSGALITFRSNYFSFSVQNVVRAPETFVDNKELTAGQKFILVYGV